MKTLKIWPKALILSRSVILAGLILLPMNMIQCAKAKQRDILLFNGDPVWSPDGTRIAFVSGWSGYYDIWVMDADGSNLQNLTNSDAIDLVPQWAPDSQSLAYISIPPDGSPLLSMFSGTYYYDVWVMKDDGTESVNLTSDFEGLAGAFAWSPDSQYLAFVVQNGSMISASWWWTETSEVWAVKLDSSDLINQITEGENRIIDLDWSPDGKLLALVGSSLSFDSSFTWVKRFSFSHPPSGFDLPGDEQQLRWSPSNNDLLAIASLNAPGAGLFDIWLVDLSDFGPINLTPDNSGIDSNPVWSPDSKFIAFESNRMETGFERNIWRMNADGSEKVNLTSDLFQQKVEFQWHMNIKPDWSPDGTQIVFQSYDGDYSSVVAQDGQSDIWVMNADGTNKVNLTERAFSAVQ